LPDPAASPEPVASPPAARSDPFASAGPTALLAHWGLPAPDSVRRPGLGTNNSLAVVEVAGRSYVLRGYQNAAVARVAAEHRFLAALAPAGLPFAVPRPIPTPDGRTCVPTPNGPVALFHFLPGRPPRRCAEALVVTGRMLGDLDQALAALPDAVSPYDWRHPLSEVHPAVPDLEELATALARALPVGTGADPGWLPAAAERADAAYTRLWETLPVQIIHGDFALSNTLVHLDGSPSAVLDFEVAGLGLRATDLVVAVSLCTDGWWTPGGGAAADLFCRAYAERVTLTSAEWAAFPDLLRIRALESLVWRCGRWRLGQASLDEVRDRLDTARRIERWLDTHGPTLVDDLLDR
jgi:homoserine kinase type II